MEPQADPNLDLALHEELRSLPNRRAPETLVPRVLAALRDRKAAPWWRQPWLAWPHGWQAVSAAALFALLGLAWWAEPMAMDQARSSLEPVSARWNALAALGHTLGGIFRLFPAGPGLEWAAVAVLYLLGVGLAVLCFRVAVSRG